MQVACHLVGMIVGKCDCTIQLGVERTVLNSQSAGRR